MSRRQKLIARMKATPDKIRFEEAVSLLEYLGFKTSNKRGSHRTYRDAAGRAVILVRPHGRHNTCDPKDIGKLLEVTSL